MTSDCAKQHSTYSQLSIGAKVAAGDLRVNARNVDVGSNGGVGVRAGRQEKVAVERANIFWCSTVRSGM